jgi:hypothetical protein
LYEALSSTLPGTPNLTCPNCTTATLEFDELHVTWVVTSCETLTAGPNTSSTRTVGALSMPKTEIRKYGNGGLFRTGTACASTVPAPATKKAPGSVLAELGTSAAEFDDDHCARWLTVVYTPSASTVYASKPVTKSPTTKRLPNLGKRTASAVIGAGVVGCGGNEALQPVVERSAAVSK